MKKKPSGFTLIEVLIVVAIIAALAAIGGSLYKSSKQRAHQAAALQKMKSLGSAFATYTVDKNGNLPLEDSTGSDDWTNAAKPENSEAWYNALPKLMNAKTGAPYPSKSKRLGNPVFAVGMNSRLQRKSGDSDVKKSGRFEQIQEPSKTVVLLERGLPNDKKTMPAQRGFDGSPKANARAFAARHNQKGCLIFADGHAELHLASDLITEGGSIIVPQKSIVWTLNPDDDPN
jgi:prepilin-type N-terminal cleavage/methylation domain-containing protein